MPIVGIDQSANHSGVTVLDDTGSILECCLIEPGHLRDVERLAFIRDKFSAILDKYPSLHLAVLEGYSYGSTSKKFVLGEVGAVIKMCLYDRGVRLYAAAPVQLKKFATGKSRASKKDVVAAVATKWGLIVDDDNLADSYALAQIGRQLWKPTTARRHELEVLMSLQKKSSKKRRPKKSKNAPFTDNI